MVILLIFVRLVEGVIVAGVAYRADAWYMKRYAHTNPSGGIGFVAGLILAVFCIGALEYLTGILDEGPIWPYWLGFSNVLAFKTGIERGRRSHT